MSYIEKRRAGLDTDRFFCTILDELNTDVIVDRFILSLSRRLAGSARHSSCLCCANSSHAARHSLR